MTLSGSIDLIRYQKDLDGLLLNGFRVIAAL